MADNRSAAFKINEEIAMCFTDGIGFDSIDQYTGVEKQADIFAGYGYDITYEINYNHNYILSSTVTEKHLYPCLISDSINQNHYLNFDLKTGEEISIEKIIAKEKIDSIHSLWNAYRRECLKDLQDNGWSTYKNSKEVTKGQHYQTKTPLDSSDLASIERDYGNRFQLHSDYIELICPYTYFFPNGKQKWNLKYKYSGIKGLLTEDFKSKIHLQ